VRVGIVGVGVSGDGGEWSAPALGKDCLVSTEWELSLLQGHSGHFGEEINLLPLPGIKPGSYRL
jgi:hypothetical protein